MEINEAVTFASQKEEQEELCNEEPPEYEAGDLVIDGIKGEGDPQVLKTKMLDGGASDVELPPKLALGYDLLTVTGSRFPVQTHHLIPEKGLKDQKITPFLTDSPKKKHSKYILGADTGYDTNAAQNGYFMPFASNTHQWKKHKGKASRRRICYEAMRRSGIQLHQGKHAKTDYGEEVDIETDGYHDMVTILLDKVRDRIVAHVEQCEDCKDSEKGIVDGRIVVRPLEATVRFVHVVSKLLKMLTNSNRIWVSKRASKYFIKFSKDGVLKDRGGGSLLKPKDL